MASVFIVGAARSGTTSLLRLFDLSPGVQAALEPTPNLNFESRYLFDGQLPNPYQVLQSQLGPRVATALASGKLYVEKQVSLVPFMSYLYEMFNCRFVIPYRDGRDVVTSTLNWHNQIYPIFYQECRDSGPLSDRAHAVLNAQDGIDPFDYSLPRPQRRDPMHLSWSSLSRREMLAWYWSHVNARLLQEIRALPADACHMIDYTSPDVAALQDALHFAGVEDVSDAAIAEVLDARVNSLQHRIGESGLVPAFNEWEEAEQQRFWDIAHPTMSALGFAEPVRPVPPGFGQWWQSEGIDENWYQEIYDYRRPSHEAFKRWFKAISAGEEDINSVIEVGSGLLEGYRELYADRSFTGIDVSPLAVQWCQEHLAGSGRQFVCADVIAQPPAIEADLVVSHGTIDNVYDMDAYLRAMAKMTRSLLYVTNYRGYFNDLEDHRRLWDPSTQVCFNDLSAAAAVRTLREQGFRTVIAFPQASGREDISAETVIIAARENVDPDWLQQGHELGFDFQPYEVQPDPRSASDILREVDERVSYFSDSPWNLTNTQAEFASMLVDLKAMPNRRLGSVQALAHSQERVNTALRVDLDMDLSSALGMAAIAAANECPLTFFVLHTAAYYGEFRDRVFHRFDSVTEILSELQSLGAEIGMHIDPLLFYTRHGVHGADAVTTELSWLRDRGIQVRGTTGHDAAPVYGAENFELLKGLDIRGEGYFERDLTYVPLGIIDPQLHGLEYEGSAPSAYAEDAIDVEAMRDWLDTVPQGDVIRDPQWLRKYLHENPNHRWGYDWNIWVLGRDHWVVSGHSGTDKAEFHYPLGWSQVRDIIATIDTQESLMLTLHPVYFGHRERAGARPVAAPGFEELLRTERFDPPESPSEPADAHRENDREPPDA